MFKDFGHGVGKAYSEMSTGYKIMYGLALFAVAGVVADNVANEGKYTKSAKDKAVKSLKSMEEVYKGIIKKTPAVVIGADSLAPTPAPTFTPAANATVKETPAPHEFTPDIKVYGSEAFKTRVQMSLDELNKTPDSFRIDGMTAYEYATYYIDELHEGDRENYMDIGKGQYPINLISPSNLIHIPRHTEQDQNQTFLADMKKWDAKGEDGSLLMEYDAIKLQVSWEKARYNLTDEQARNSFLTKMKYYTNDSKYFEDNLSVN
jgi:hypothetical protein